MKNFRLIRSQPGEACDNMVQDQSLFSRYLEDGIPVFRVYRWRGPAFTYGIAGHPEEEINLKLCEQDNVGVAQRITGGGVLFHDDELTYSLVCSKDDIGEDKFVFVDYRKICSFLINFYQSLGLKVG